MELVVLNDSFETVAIIDVFKSLIWTDRFNAYGDFEVYLTVSQQAVEYMQQGYYLQLKESDRSMIIESLSIDSDVENGTFFVVTGRSLEVLLERRIVWDQTILTGSLQDGIQTLLNNAIISPTNTDRKINNFIFQASTDTRITELTVEAEFYGEDLYSAIQGLCEANEIGFKVILNDSNQFVFSLYVGEDRSYEQTTNPYVIFSPSFENIINSNYYTSIANMKNVALVAGEGEGASRKMNVVGEATGLDRRELYTDARDISSDTENGTLSDTDYLELLRIKGVVDLVDHSADVAFEGEVETTRLFKYAEDFFIGDIVQIANEYGQEGRAYISELVISQSEEGSSVYPTFTAI